MQVDRDSNTGLSVSKTKGRKWNIGTHSHSKELPTVTNRTSTRNECITLPHASPPPPPAPTPDTHAERNENRPVQSVIIAKDKTCNNNNNIILLIIITCHSVTVA